LKVVLPYNLGKEKIEVEIASKNVQTLSVKYISGNRASREVLRILRSNRRIFEKMRGKRIVILVDDHTRPTPIKEVLPPVLDFLEKLKCDVKIIYACGTHNVNKEKLKFKLGDDLLRENEVIVHDAYDHGINEFVGITSLGTPIWVNREYLKADYRIGIGSIFPSEIAGFTGGCKIVLPGISSVETINRNHSLFLSPNASIGNIDNNPVRKDIDEAGILSKLHFVLDFVMNSSDNSIVRGFFGHPIAAHREGVKLCRNMYTVNLSARADVVLVSPGSVEDIDFTQAIKCLFVARRAVKRGGKILMFAAMPNGLEWEELEELILKVRERGMSKDDLLKIILGDRVESFAGIIIYKLYDLFINKNVETILISKYLSRKKADLLGYKLYRDPQKAIDEEVNQSISESQRIVIIPHGASTIIH